MRLRSVQRIPKTLPHTGLVASVSGRPERNMHMGLVYEDAGTLGR